MLAQVVMYVGRDEDRRLLPSRAAGSLVCSSLTDLGLELGHDIDRSLEIRQMIGKMPLGDYLSRGLRLLLRRNSN